MKRILIGLEVQNNEYDKTIEFLQNGLDNPQNKDVRITEYETYEPYEIIPDIIKREEDKDVEETIYLKISMAYTYVGTTGIDIPIKLLEGKTREEKYKIAFEYAQEHIGDIPIAQNVEYIPDSDQFDMDDIKFEKYEEV